MQRPDSPGDGTSRNTSDLKSLFAELDSTPITEMNVDSMIARFDASTAQRPTNFAPVDPVTEGNAGPRNNGGRTGGAAHGMSGPAVARPTIDDDGSDERDDDAVPGQFIPSFHDVNPTRADDRPPERAPHDLGSTVEPSAPDRGMPRMDISSDVLDLWTRSDEVYTDPDRARSGRDDPQDEDGVEGALISVSSGSYPAAPAPDDQGKNAATTTPVTSTAPTETPPTHEPSANRLDTPKVNTGSPFATALEKAKTAARWYRAKDARAKILIGIVVIVVFLAIAQMFTGGNSAENTTTSGPAAVVEQPETPAPVDPQTTDGVLQPTSVAAECPSGSSRPELALSADPKDAWICVRAQGIDGAILTLTFRRPVVITEVSLVPGFNYVEASGVDRWTEHRLPTKLLWTFNDDTELIQDIVPARTGATMKVNAIATQSISLTVMQTATPKAEQVESGLPFALSPSTGTDSFALSRLQITGHEA
jgi:hypothetical protein